MAGDLGGITNLTGLNVGGGGAYLAGSNMYGIKASVITVVATTCTATKSVDTTGAFSGLTIGDVVVPVAGGSGLSAGIALDAWVSAVDVVTIRYSNVSAANAAQIATPITVLAFKVVA